MTKATITKKIVVLLTTITMLAGMIIPASAAPLAASQPNEGTITVHKYERNTKGTAHPDNVFSGEALDPSITVGLGNPLPGAGFTLFKLNMSAVEAVLTADPTDAITGYVVNETAAPVYTVTFSFVTAADVAVTVTDPTDVVNAATGLVDGAGAEVLTNAAGIATWGAGKLLDGSYLLVETTVPAGHIKTASSVIRTPLTLNDGTDANRDVHVYPKNVIDGNIVNKVVDGSFRPINTNDIIPFKITTIFKNGLDKTVDPTNAVENVQDLRGGDGTVSNPYVYGSFKVMDTLQSYFRFTDTAVVAGTPVGALPGVRNLDVYLINGAGVRITGTNALTTGDFTVSGIVPGVYGQTGTIEIVLTNAGIDKAVAAWADALVVSFDAHYIGGATADEGTTTTDIKNTADAEMAPNGGTTPDIPENEVKIPKAAIQIDKIDEEGNAFEDAEFALARVIAPTISFSEADWAANNYTATQLGTLLTEYVCGVNGKPITAITDSSGNMIFDSVPYTDAGVTYYLKELSTQAGYELPVSTIAVKLPSKAEIISNPDYAALKAVVLNAADEWVDGALVKVTAEVENFPQGTSQDFSLPLTGGLGTTLFTIIGILLMLGAVVIYIKAKKRSVQS